MSREHVQRSNGHGGKRAGAGRTRGKYRLDAPHRSRPKFTSPTAVHVTMRCERWVLELRDDRIFAVLSDVLARYFDRTDFRVVHLSIQDNHLHVIVEAASDRALDRGMRSFAINAARAIHRVFGGCGRVFFRYHSTLITTRRYARNVLAYVLGNWRRHRKDFANGRLLPALLDPYSSAISGDDEESLRAAHVQLCAKWELKDPLHSSEIRARSKKFGWLLGLSKEKRAEFMDDITRLVTRPELTAIACVIDRPGYNHRYLERYGRNRWQLCKTTFAIVVERAAKRARDVGCRLRVLVERSDKETDRQLRDYYDQLRSGGHPFDAINASKYKPLDAVDYGAVLYEFRTKSKSSPPMQVADLCLWPICIGGYDPGNLPYTAMKVAGTLVDAKLEPEQVPTRGIKYYCWDLVDAAPKKPNPGQEPGSGQPPSG